jgi:rhamnosyltransferase
VAYNPGEEIVRAVQAVASQVTWLIVVDNASAGEGAGWVHRGVESAVKMMGASRVLALWNPENYGIAQGLNQGLAQARSLRADFVLLLDQDSIVSGGYVDRLLADYYELRATIPIGALVGWNVDQRGGAIPPLLVAYCNRRGAYHDSSRQELFLAKTSGTFAAVSTFDVVGDFRAEFFIASVDHEMCFRLRRARLKTILIPDARIEHPWNRTIRVHFVHRSAEVEDHAPARQYFAARNSLATAKLYLRDFPLDATLYVIYSFARIGKLVLISPRRRAVVSAAASGILDFLQSRMGRGSVTPG